jgi:hypothetical protein
MTGRARSIHHSIGSTVGGVSNSVRDRPFSSPKRGYLKNGAEREQSIFGEVSIDTRTGLL